MFAWMLNSIQDWNFFFGGGGVVGVCEAGKGGGGGGLTSISTPKVISAAMPFLHFCTQQISHKV